MNRKIKFRMKDKQGEWQYVEMTCSIIEALKDPVTPGGIDIDENTIGQYTGIDDKNGKEIYVGDILKSIQWNDIYLVKHIGTAYYLCRKGKNGFNKRTTWNNAEKSEVIGNIYDNPELLGGE